MEIMQDLLNSEALNAAEDLLYFKEHPCNHNSTVVSKTTEDKNVQVNTFDNLKIWRIDTFIDTNNKCNVLTGIVSISILDVLDKALQAIDQEKCQLTCRQKILLTMMRLKLDLSYVSLAIFFQISSKSVKRYFDKTIQHLSMLLKPVIRFPPKEEISANIPNCFRNYQSTRIVLDCTEMYVEKSKCLRCRLKTYSHYKSRHTVKFLIGVTPSGLISYLSKGYGGRTSDKAIFNNENLIEKLEIGDSIMVDKGFLIEKECSENFIKLIRPPFLKKEKQFQTLRKLLL